LLSFD